jgi:hypothetical protein
VIGLETNLRSRRWVIDRLRAEIVGPDAPSHAAIVLDDGASAFRFASWEEFRKPKRQSNGEEVLWQDRPTKRYGAGILYPAETTDDQIVQEESDATIDVLIADEGVADTTSAAVDKIADRTARDDSENFDVTLANAYRPSAIGISFVARLDRIATITINVAAASYVKRPAVVTTPQGDRSQELWLRKPLSDGLGAPLTISIPTSSLHPSGKTTWEVPGCPRQLEVVVLSRPQRSGGTNAHVITVSLVNRRPRATPIDEHSYFQVGLRVTGSPDGGWILPYRDPSFTRTGAVSEESINKLLYRDRHTFAVGHGCAARWRTETGEDGLPIGVSVETEVLPEEETPSITADLRDEMGEPIRVSMRTLAGFGDASSQYDEIERLLGAYATWIEAIADIEHPKRVVPGVHRPPILPQLSETAEELVRRCRDALRRMRRGFDRVRTDTTVARAFAFANEAMLISQLRASRDVRQPTWAEKTATIDWDRPAENPDPKIVHASKGYWRAFQIAFILLSIDSVCDPSSDDRETVDVIWFPTGGGKTEAYLGLTAFTLLYHRLAGRNCAGSTVLMRYTLRLLTTQQFQRAGLLFCALEDIRARHKQELGEREFSLGMWVGGSSTPNRRADATAALTKLEKDSDAENPFVLLKCPWCNAHFGPTTQKGSRLKVYGYRKRKVGEAITVSYLCPDTRCAFSRRPLPLLVVDEDIYSSPPDLIIGTVDKFALMAWNPAIRSFFGIAPDGTRLGAPPALIIQDELHLISGPLGSMVGAYETVIEELCTSRENEHVIRPKIIASTATISRAGDQVRAVYARTRFEVFPPSGLEAGDSFFAREARREDGTALPGRMYVGVMATGHGSMQTTQARVFATLLQSAAILDDGADTAAARDPWWTLLAFFNSLRELGGAATLLIADARDYLRVIIDRQALPYQVIRQLRRVEELTSRIRNDEVPRSIQKLEHRYTSEKGGEAVDACLASSIIEVGVDIDRLSLMTITGQPKTTAQYIQVSSRIGRDADAPGLVVTMYSPSKPRDRSHYERFTSYHQRLYSQVEPTSVTPFSPPAVDRALHGLLVSFVRQLRPAEAAENPRPFERVADEAFRARIEECVRTRVAVVDPEEWKSVARLLDRRWAEWRAWDPSTYGTHGVQSIDAPLMYPAGATPSAEWSAHGWATLTSLRDVDASCEADVTQTFNEMVVGA